MSGTQTTALQSEDVLESWKKHLARLHEDLTGLEQANECIEILLGALREGQSRFLFSFCSGLFAHWAAIGARRLYKKGNPRYDNVALQRLMDGIIGRPDVVLKHADPDFMAQWIERGAGESISPDDVIRAVRRDRDHLDVKMSLVGAYADTIAHLQLVGDDRSGELKIKGREISDALAEVRRHVRIYHILLTGDCPPDLNANRFVEGLEDEVDRLISSGPSGFV